MRTALFWVITQRVVVIYYLFNFLFITFRDNLSVLSAGVKNQKTESRNYHYSLRNDPEERSYTSRRKPEIT
jgi:hypothetical protein